MSIGLTDELEVKTKKGKLTAAKQVFLEGDQENLQQIGDKTHQLENAIKDITATGGASTANAVSYNNETSGMTAVTAQGAIDELVTKNKSQDTIIGTKAEKADVQSSVSELKAKNTSQDAEIAKKANSADVASQMQTEQTRVNAELGKKFDKKSILQESGEADDKVMSQKAVTSLSKSFPSVFNNGVTFIPLVLAHEFTAINQSINIKTPSLSGNFRLLVTANIANALVRFIAISINDANGTSYKSNPDFSYKQRFVFDLENVSGLSSITFGTYGKQEATFKPCVVSAVLYNKNAEDFVDIWKDIDNGKANKSEVDSLVKKIEDKISSNEGTTIECSESFICPVGETIQIFYKSIFNGININDFIISCRSNVGKSYPRYFEYKPTELGNKSVTFSLCKFDGYEYKVVSTKSVTIECIQHPKSSSKNILIIGDSLTLYNSMQDEILRRINKEGGEPEGYKLACNFLGRKTTSNGTKFEGISGYSWQKYTTRLGRSFKFTVPSTTNTSVGSKYKVQMNDGSNKNLQVIEVNISNDNSASSYIKLVFDSDYDDLKKNPLTNGTLSKVSGSGDTNISYTQYEVESYSPFVNNNDEVDFKPYFDQYCNGKVDIMVIELGTNDITSLLNKNLNTFDLINYYINLHCGKFISKLHEQYPNTQLVILGLHKCSQNGGMSNVSNTNDPIRYCRYIFKWNEALKNMAKESDYTHYIDVNAQFDSENSYDNNVTKQVNLRSSKVEPIDYNSVHPITSGLQLIADSVVRYLCKIL